MLHRRPDVRAELCGPSLEDQGQPRVQGLRLCVLPSLLEGGGFTSRNTFPLRQWRWSSTSSASPSTYEMAEGTTIHVRRSVEELKKRSALDGVDLSAPSEERTRSLRQEINFMVAHSLHRHSENLVNTLERVALRVIQEIMRHQYSPSGPALGTHQGEMPLQSRPPLPFALAAPEVPNSPAYVVYKIGGDPSDYQFLYERRLRRSLTGGASGSDLEKQTWLAKYATPTNLQSSTPASGSDLEKQTWLAKYATPTNLQSSTPAASSELEKQAWLAKYATPANLQSSTPAASTADQISTILRDQFGMVPKRRAIGYSKPYPNEYDLIPLPPKYRLPEFSKFSGSDGSSSIEHVSRYLAQLGTISASDELRVRFFAQSLTGSAFGWYTSLPPDSIRTWKQLEEQFHMQYHSEASEAGIADLAQVRQKRGETVSEYIQRFRTVRNRCYSARLTEKEAVELAVVGLASPIKDMASQADYPSLAHMVQKLSLYEQRHPELYQDKFKRAVVLVEADEDEGSTEIKRGFDFDVTKAEQIFDLLLKEKQLKGVASADPNGDRTRPSNFSQYAMKVDTHPFPAVNMVECTYPGRCQPGFSFSINMVGPGHHSGKDRDEGSRSHNKDKEEAVPRDRLRHDGKRYITEGEVKNVRYQPLSDHLLNKYVSQYDQRRRYDDDDERDRLASRDARRHRRHDRDEERYERHAKEKSREQDDVDRHWGPFFKHCWDSGMSRLPTIDNCPECRQKKKGAGDVSVNVWGLSHLSEQAR
ncbi:hypothetical protein QYE76_030764 [Lolium multiflorum]|uniref:Retrotransposon gag domain-containing protein n=1 Tax=Lolium multiflorum TaxID=4521 RepID=A0AAD8QRU4_LOLMU|nr:hypothetical protein QYE76_030764 [Lolium multiflorum]